MTWEELKEKAKEMGAVFYDNERYFRYSLMFFHNDGVVSCRECDTWFSQNRTPEQMLMIMRGLE